MMSSCRLCLSMSCSCTTPASNANSKICYCDCHAGCRTFAECQHAGFVLRRHIAEEVMLCRLKCLHGSSPILISFSGRVYSIPQRCST